MEKGNAGTNLLSYPEWKHAFIEETKEWGNNLMEWQTPTDFDNISFPYSCVVCKRGEICDVKVTACEDCKIVSYCSPEHKAEDCSNHAILCQSVKAFRESIKSNPKFIFPSSKLLYQEYLISSLKVLGPLCAADASAWEKNMRVSQWERQPHCQVCFKTPLLNNITLKLCDDCHLVATCEDINCIQSLCIKHSPEVCQNYLCHFASKILCMQNGSSLVVVSNGAICPNNKHMLDNAAGVINNGWNEYFKTYSHLFDLPTDMIRLPPVTVSVLRRFNENLPV